MTYGLSGKFFKNTEHTRNTLIIYKRIFSEKQTRQFKLKLQEFGWTKLLALEDNNKPHDDFLNIFSTYYN